MQTVTGAVTAASGVQYVYRGLLWHQQRGNVRAAHDGVRLRARQVEVAARRGLAVAGRSAPVRAATTPARALLDKVKALNQTTRKWTDRVQRMTLTIVDRRGGEYAPRARGDDQALRRRRQPLDHVLSRARRRCGASASCSGSRRRSRIVSGCTCRRSSAPARSAAARARESFVGTDFSYEDLSIMADVLDWGEDKAAAARRRRGDDRRPRRATSSSSRRPPAADVSYGTDPPVARPRRPGGAQVRVSRCGRASSPRRCCSPTSATPNGIPAAHHLEMRNEKHRQPHDWWS